jgi:hypothetical protein
VNAHGVEGVATAVECSNFSPGQVPSDAPPPPAGGLALRVTPNPFNPSARVSFHLERPSDVRVALYDVAGRRVHDWLLPGLPAGDHGFALDAAESGLRMASGIYFLEVDASSEQARTRVVLLK